MNRNRDLLLILLLNGVLLAVVAFSEVFSDSWIAFLRSIFGLLYLLFAPGYALQAALMPSHHHASSLDRFVFSMGLSIAVAPWVGLALDGPPGGIFLQQTLAILTAFTCLICGIAIYRRRGLVDHQPAEVVESLGEWWQSQSSSRKIFVTLVPVIVLIGVALAIFVLIYPHPDQALTEFYLLDRDNAAIYYPDQVTLGQPFTLRTGVVNHEGLPQEYQIEIWSNNVLLSRTDLFALDDGQSQETDVPVVLNITGRQYLQLHLMRNEKMIRRLLLWVEVK